jgi:hypothetical protein
MKIVRSFSNSSDNLHCLQACVKMVLHHCLPGKKFSESLIDKKTGHVGGATWILPAVIWMDKLELTVNLFSTFDYANFGKRGESFLKENWNDWKYEFEKNTGALKNLSFVQQAAVEMVARKLWTKEVIDQNYLAKVLKSEKNLAIGKTIYELLDGNSKPTVSHSHYVVLVKEYSFHNWLVNDPGLPEKAGRVVPKIIDNRSIFNDVLLIEGKKI